MMKLFRLKKSIRKYVHQRVAEVGDNEDLHDLGLDSLDFVEIVMEVEEEMDIHVEQVELRDARTICDIFEILKQKI